MVFFKLVNCIILQTFYHKLYTATAVNFFVSVLKSQSVHNINKDLVTIKSLMLEYFCCDF